MSTLSLYKMTEVEMQSGDRKMVMALLDHWQLSTEDQAALLGIVTSNRAALSHLLGIHKNLRLLFPQNRDLAYRWMTTRNKAFDNLTPAEVVKEWGFAGLLMVRGYLDRARGPKDPVANARAFFDQLKPLDSFAEVDSQSYVQVLRSDRRTQMRKAAAKARDGMSAEFQALGADEIMAFLRDMAADVFASENDAATWLQTPHPLLDNEKPLDAIKTSYGAQLVRNLLMSTKYGGAS